MSKKYNDFTKELEGLCEKHKVYLITDDCRYALEVLDYCDSVTFDYYCFDDMTDDV